VAAQKPADILFLVSAAFSFAAAAFFPALVLGIFWKRANRWGASLGMICGLGITFYYMVTTQPWLRGIFGITSPVELWFGIQPISAGVFGVPLGFAVIILVSLVTPARRAKERRTWSSMCATPAKTAAEAAAHEAKAEGVKQHKERSSQQRYQDAYPIATRLTASLGLRGFRLNLAVEAAGNYEQLGQLAPKIREAVGQEKYAPLEDALNDR
jgi:hypothetical protein